MKAFQLLAASAATAVLLLSAGCASPEHRMATAANRDDTRRMDFEHCRAAGGTECDKILNAPVNSNTAGEDHGDRVREQEQRAAYDRCRARNGSDCDDLLEH